MSIPLHPEFDDSVFRQYDAEWTGGPATFTGDWSYFGLAQTFTLGGWRTRAKAIWSILRRGRFTLNVTLHARIEDDMIYLDHPGIRLEAQ